MATGKKFGTFGGVYTPSLLTILGVIMYLRLPRVLSEAGLYTTLGIIFVAHIISFSTGLSISSIATDKKVGAGGPYYIVSRSLGLPLGGTLGLALFVGLSFSVSLYIIGFARSFLGYWDIEATPNAVRITGCIVLVVLCIVAMISTALAIKTQYVVFALIALSLVSIFTGSPAEPATAPHLLPPADGEAAAVLFGIFFPAVTGFTAGVNMSGDLQQPRRAIPRGTMLAIITGLIVYVGLAIFLAYRVLPAQLQNEAILVEMARVPAAVVAGIWGATLSSALGSILGAPRILQATSNDRITPKWFAHGHGPGREPRRALFVAFVIALAGILIAQLDTIARIVSMVFLTMYGVLNLSCAIESWASPDFRPTFRIPRWVSLAGAATTFLVMIELDLAAMVGATVLMAAVFALLKRRQLQLDSGDTWEGIWSTMVRSGLFRLSLETSQQRNWRPNIVHFNAPMEASQRDEVDRLATALVTGSGMLTSFVDRKALKQRLDKSESDENKPGIFQRELNRGDLPEQISLICHHYGFAGLSPNTLMVGHVSQSKPSSTEPDPTDEKPPSSAFTGGGKRGLELLKRTTKISAEADFNLLFYAPINESSAASRIDVWWREGAGNLPFCLALLRFITSSPTWQDSKVRVLVLSTDTGSNDALRAVARRLIGESRVEAELVVVNHAPELRSFDECIVESSADAELTIVPISDQPGEDLGAAWNVTVALHRVLFVRASSSFPEVLGAARGRPISLIPPASDGSGAQLPELTLPDPVELAEVVSDLGAKFQKLLGAHHDRCLQNLYAGHIDFAKQIKKALDTHCQPLVDADGTENPRRQATAINRAQSGFLLEAQRIVKDFRERTLVDHKAILGSRIEAVVSPQTIVDLGLPERIVVHRSAEEFAPDPDDSPYVRSFKRNRRFIQFFRKSAGYNIWPERIHRYYFEELLKLGIGESTSAFLADSFQLAIYLGRVLNSARVSLSLVSEVHEDGESPVEFAQAEYDKLAGRLDEIIVAQKEKLQKRQWGLLVCANELTQAYAQDIDRLDVMQLASRKRRINKKGALALRTELSELSDNWHTHQDLLVRRVDLALQISAFRHRFVAAMRRENDGLASQLEGGALAECRTVESALKSYIEQLEAHEDGPLPRFACDIDTSRRFEAAPFVDKLLQTAAASTAELPEDFDTVSDASIQQLEEGVTETVEPVDVPVRRLMHFMVEADFVGEMQSQFARVPVAEQTALSVAQDVVRLMSVHPDERNADDDEEADPKLQQLEAARSSLGRVEAEIKALSRETTGLVEAMLEQLRKVLDSANAYDLTTFSETLNQRMRRHQRVQAVSGARALTQRIQKRLEKATVGAVYRRSTATILAREIREKTRRHKSPIETLLRLVTQNMPSAAVVDGLPFFYRQLFLGQSTMASSFWFGRAAELATAKRVIEQRKQGAVGALFLTGERGSGKTALADRILSELVPADRTFRVVPPPTGSHRVTDFKAALETSIGVRGSFSDILQSVPEGSVILLEDLELWWDRGSGGDAVIERITTLLDRHASHCLFMITVGTRAFTLLDRLNNLSDRALATVDCGPVDTETLQSIVLARHASTGMKFELGDTPEEELSRLKMARLFSSHFDNADGFVGASLRSWITNVRKIKGNVLSVVPAEQSSWEALDHLRVEQSALLVQLILHKRASARPAGAVERDSETRPQPRARDAASSRLDRDGSTTQLRDEPICLPPGRGPSRASGAARMSGWFKMGADAWWLLITAAILHGGVHRRTMGGGAPSTDPPMAPGDGSPHAHARARGAPHLPWLRGPKAVRRHARVRASGVRGAGGRGGSGALGVGKGRGERRGAQSGWSRSGGRPHPGGRHRRNGSPAWIARGRPRNHDRRREHRPVFGDGPSDARS